MRTMKIVGLWLCLSVVFACKKDEGVSDCVKLEGTWLCESWKENGIQLMGDTSLITTAQIQFKVLTGDQGDFEKNIDYVSGSPDMIIGAYVVNADCTEVTITPKAGSPAVYDFFFQGGELHLEGIINSVETNLIFKKE